MNLDNSNTSAVDIYNSIGKKLQVYYRERSPIERHINSESDWELEKSILSLLSDLFIQSEKENFFWTDCTLEVFKNTLPERLTNKRILSGNPGLSQEKMLIKEYDYLNKIAPQLSRKYYSHRMREDYSTSVFRYLGAAKPSLNDYVSLDYQPILEKDSELRENFEDARIEKVDFIEDYFRKEGKVLKYKDGAYKAEFITKDKSTLSKKKNKSVLFNGKELNLTERIKIANDILDFDSVIRKLNIQDTEKYQLMAYILGNDVSNVRNVINGTRPNKIREKEINEYLEYLKK